MIHFLNVVPIDLGLVHILINGLSLYSAQQMYTYIHILTHKLRSDSHSIKLGKSTFTVTRNISIICSVQTIDAQTFDLGP